ncbi:MAG TPA: carboxypeptidase-like regulatory domain-containing protein, partial [Terracidiphilus sp.]|nr:carboxypeptidase-like regulatory domain-containing protein [Terracidiphilus sp.]
IAMALLCRMPAAAQNVGVLPDSPQTQVGAQAQSGISAAAGSSIAGTVLDTAGDVVQGARVELKPEGTPGTPREVKSGATGQFEFTGVAPGTYVVTVSGSGMTEFVSKPIAVHADEPVMMSSVVLRVEGGATTVRVMDKEAASIQQVHIAEQQRVMKVFPNFYSSFDWNAPSMLAKQKYHLAVRTLIDPVTFLTSAGIAGAEQYKNVFPSFGGGLQGYGKRYLAAYATHASGELLTRAVFPGIFHTDPRYFVMKNGSARARTEHAIGSTFLTRGDDGKRRINFAEILGSFSSAALSEAYFPAQERGGSLVMINGFGDLGGDAVDNLIREFLLGRMTSRAKQ